MKLMYRLAQKYQAVVVYCILIVSVTLVFWQVRDFHFINYDDNLYVTANQHVLSGLNSESVIWAFTTGHSANWHPVTWLSLMLDCQLFGPSPDWMHIVNGILHLANTLLLFTVLKKMTDALWPSAFVAAIFALHPMHVESVAWVAERKDVLSTLFWLLTLAAYACYVKRPSIFRYLVTLVIFAIGLMAKPMLVTLPAALILLDYWPLERFLPQTTEITARQSRKSIPPAHRFAVLKHLIIEKIPFFVLSVISSVITFLVQQGGGTVADINAFSLKSRVVNVFLSYARYIGKMFWPQNLAVFYPLDIERFSFYQIVLFALLLLVISFYVIYFGRKQRYLPVGWFWFIVTLIPVIGLVQVGDQAYADRYSYIPYIGLFIMLTWGLPELLSRVPYRKIVLGVAMVIVLTIFAIATFRQVSYWQNSSTLFSHAVRTTQNNYIAYCCLGDDLRLQGKPALAIEQYKKAIQIEPRYANAVLNLGSALGDQGNTVEAMQYFRKAIELEPSSAFAALAHNGLGLAFKTQGRLAEAVAHFTQAVRLNPDLAEARYNFANVLILADRPEEALDQFRAAIRLKPDWPDPMNNLALLAATRPQLKGRDVNEAVRLADRACKLTNYKNPTFMGTLAAAYASAGRFQDAIAAANTALTLADAANQIKIKKIIEYHLSFYTRGKPYIEPDKKPLADPNRP